LFEALPVDINGRASPLAWRLIFRTLDRSPTPPDGVEPGEQSVLRGSGISGARRLEAKRPPDVLAPVPEVHGEVVSPKISAKVALNEPPLPVRPADRPDQRLDPCLSEALLEIQVSGRMAHDWVDQRAPSSHSRSIVPRRERFGVHTVPGICTSETLCYND
jgi:hypothetical protein